MMRRRSKCLALLLILAAPLAAEEEKKPILEGLPVREVTIFKDGSAWVEHRGAVKPSGSQVILQGLPAPYMGTFWVSALDEGGKVVSVVASDRDSTVATPATHIHELLRANEGKKVSWSEAIGSGEKGRIEEYVGTVLPRQQKEETYILVRLDGGSTVVLDPARAMNLRFHEELTTKFPKPVKAASLTVTTEGAAAEPQLSVSYVQEGIRWVPGYRVEVGEGGKATVILQATIVNDLVDLQDVSASLVIGVPSFAFKGETDPISLQRTIAEVAAAPQNYGYSSPRMRSFSNAVMSQTAGYAGGAEMADEAGAPPPPTVDAGEKAEDLFVFGLDHITLKKGERMVIPVGRYEVPAETVFRLVIPFGPPPGVLPQNGDPSQMDEIQRSLGKAQVKAYLRLTNTTSVPFTTAPAMIVRGDRILAQGLMKYTAPNGRHDLETTTAVDIRSRKRDREVERVPNVMTINGNALGRVDVEGVVQLENLRGTPVLIEVRREVLGKLAEVSDNGEIAQLTGDWDDDAASTPRPAWWNWYGFPWWYWTANQVGTATWNLELKPGEKKDLTYRWSYFWNS